MAMLVLGRVPRNGGFLGQACVKEDPLTGKLLLPSTSMLQRNGRKKPCSEAVFIHSSHRDVRVNFQTKTSSRMKTSTVTHDCGVSICFAQTMAC